jgi:hypothetical protein
MHRHLAGDPAAIDACKVSWQLFLSLDAELAAANPDNSANHGFPACQHFNVTALLWRCSGAQCKSLIGNIDDASVTATKIVPQSRG